MRRVTGFAVAALLVGAVVLAAPLSALAANLVLTLGAAPASISEGGSVQPFDGITVTDDETVTATVTYDSTAGSLSGTTVTDTAANVTAFLDALVFTGAPGFTGTTQVTVSVNNTSQNDSESVTISVNPTLPGPTTVTITANGTAVYGAGAPALTPTISDPSVITVPPTCVYTAGTPTNPPVGSYATICSGAVAPGYTIDYQPGEVTVTAAPATVTASSSGPLPYGSALPTITPTYGGLQYGETTIAGVTCVSAALAVPTVASTCGGSTSANYTVVYVPGTVTVTPVPLTASPVPPTTTYGTLARVGATYTGFVNGETSAVLTTQPTCVTTVVATTPVGGYPATATCAGAVAQNYTISYGPAVTTTVTPAKLTITALGQSRLVGQPNGAFSSTNVGFVNGEGLGNLSGTLVFTTTATTSSGAGSYPVQPSGVTSPNYAISFVPGIIRVTAVAPTPTPTPTPTATKTPTPTPSPTSSRTPSPSPTPQPVVPTTGFDWLPIVLIGAGTIFIAAILTIIVWSRRQ